jgi:hypothetical protein
LAAGFSGIIARWGLPQAQVILPRSGLSGQGGAARGLRDAGQRLASAWLSGIGRRFQACQQRGFRRGLSEGFFSDHLALCSWWRGVPLPVLGDPDFP